MAGERSGRGPGEQSANPAEGTARADEANTRNDNRRILLGKVAFTIIRRDCPARLVLAGEFDIGSVSDLAAAVSEAASKAGVLHVDLADVQFCDLAALRTIVGTGEAGDHQRGLGRPVVLHHPSAEVERMLHLTGWHALPGLTLDHGKACSGPR